MNGDYFVRLAEFDDVKELNELISSTGGPSIYKATFGAFNFSYVIEHSFLSVIATADTEENEMKGAGFASSNDALPALLSDGDLYPIVFEMLVNHFPATTDNTNFINFWILDENTKYSKQIGDEMLKKLFALSPAVDYLVWLCPKSFIPIEYVTNTFKEIKLQLSENDKKETIGKLLNCKALYVHRSKFLPKLLVRDAKVEDNDDLIPILRNSNNPNMLNHQNEYFLSDLIDSQDNYNRFYVGLNHTTIVGMLATSEDVNVPLITKIFQIDQFNDIIMEKTERELPPPLFIAIVGDIRLLDLYSTNNLCTNLNCVFVNAEVANINNQNNNESKIDEDDDTSINQQQQQSSSSSTSEFNSLQLFLQQLAKEYDMRLQSAIIFFGYPSNEYEAYERRSDLVYQFDYIIEIINTNDDAEEDDDDDYLQHHLDAVEILRDKFSHVQINTTKTIWKKISLDGAIMSKNDSVYILREELNLIIDQRNTKIEAQCIQDRDDPPKANAFAITVFCLTDDYVSRAYDMIQVAFDDHSHLDYLFYMVPNIPPPPTELIRNMYYVPIKPGTSFDQSLYLMHRSSLLLNDFFTINRYNFNMKPKFHTYITTKTKLPITKQHILYEAANNCLKDNDIDIKDNPGEICFIINIGNHIIGMLTLSRKIITNEDSNWIRANYYADEIINYDRHRIRSQIFITNWYLESLYASSCTRRIIQEVMRRCLKTLIYYQIDHQIDNHHHHNNKNNSIIDPPKELINELITLKPRKRMQATNELKVEYIIRPSIDIGGLSSQSPLLFLSKYLLARPKSIIPKRIVIAGGNSHSYAILETLCSVPYLNFPNIYLIIESIPTPLKVSLVSSSSSSGGGDIDEESKYDDDYSGCLSIKDEQFPTEKYLYSLGMGHKLKVIRGHLTDIDREHRTIVISNETALEYDLLVIATNMEDGGIKAIPSLRQMHPSRCADSGIFSLGSPSLDRRAMEYIMKRYPVRTDDVIISGTGIAALAAISSLINMGIASNRITLLVRSEEHIVDDTIDKFIGDAVMTGLQSTGVKIYWGYAVSEIHLAHTGFLSSVEVKKASSMVASDGASTIGDSKSNSRSILNYSRDDDDDDDDYDYRPQQEAGIMLACLALLCCSQPQCSRDIFNAINDCGLVYDGGLVVDPSFRTVDKAIYSVGDYTRFSRIHKNPIPHKNFNGIEMGTYVGLKILEEHLDPISYEFKQKYHITTRAEAFVPFKHNTTTTTTNNNNNNKITNYSSSSSTSSRATPSIPTFVLPKTISCTLPGDLYYFYSRLPVLPKDILDYKTSNFPLYASVMTVENRNCILNTDHYGYVVDFTYVGENKIENYNLSLIVGIHESFLSCAVASYSEGYLNDWISHFRKSWANALYYDKYPILLQALRKSLLNDKGMIMLLSRVFERAENVEEDQEISFSRRDYIGVNGELTHDHTMRTIEGETVDFIRENNNILTSYYISGHVNPTTTTTTTTTNASIVK